jgi:hypothetical protein
MAGGGFAGGLADGLNNVMGLYMQNQYYTGLNDNREETNRNRQEALEARIAKSEGGGNSSASTKGPDREGFMSSLVPVFKGGNNQAAAPRPAMTSEAGLGPATLPNTGLLSGNPAAAYQAPGLASVPTQAQPEPTQAEDNFNPIHEIVKQVAFGDLANDPNKLGAIRAAAAMHGMGKEIDPWLDHLVGAKKSGVFDAAMSLKRGDVDGAMTNLERGGIKLEDRPVKVDPNDNSKWKVNISGSGEQEINLDDWATSTLDPEKYAKFALDRQESSNKTRVADAQIKKYNANATESLAGAGLKNAQSTAAKLTGGLGGTGGTRADKPEQIDKALKRRDDAIDDMSSTQGDDGKYQVDPQRRLKYSALAVGSQQSVEDHLGRDMTAKEQHKLTDMLRTADSVGSKAEWDSRLANGFGYASAAPAPARTAQPRPSSTSTPPAAVQSAPSAPPPVPAPPASPGGLQMLRQQQQVRDQMTAIQNALQSPNLSPEQKRDLALQANALQNAAVR